MVSRFFSWVGYGLFKHNSLVHHIDDLRVFMSQFIDIDILAINKAKLDSTIEDGEVHRPGYDVVPKDRESNRRNGGGVCIYVRSNINFQLRSDLSQNASLLKSLRPAQSLSSCLPGTNHHNHLLASF